MCCQAWCESLDLKGRLERQSNGQMDLPASIRSASPCRMKLKASPMECAPVVQAVDTAWLGPSRPCCMLTIPAAMLTSSLGTTNGLNLQ